MLTIIDVKLLARKIREIESKKIKFMEHFLNDFNWYLPLAGLFFAGNSGGLVLLLSLFEDDVDEDSDPFFDFLYLVEYL